MSSNVCGYDEKFVNDPPESLKCTICHFVLRDPVQVLECGHAFCSCCFETLRGHSSELDLICPVDRLVIDCSKVVKDKFVDRMITDLHVYCKYKDHGCSWDGELRNLETHYRKCLFALQGGSVEEKHHADGAISAEVMKQIFLRLETCEKALLEKEKDIAHLKFKNKEEFDKSEKEITILKQKVMHGEEVRKLQDGKLEALIKDIGELKMTNMMLQNKLDQKQDVDQHVECVEKCVLAATEIKKLKDDMKELTDKFENNSTKSGGVDGKKLNNERGGAGVPLNLAQWSNHSIEDNIVEGEIDLLTLNPGVYYSSLFYCHTNGFPCKIGVNIFPDKGMKLIFVPEDGMKFPNETIFKIKLDLYGNNIVLRNIFLNEVKYKQNVGYLLLRSMNKCDYQIFLKHREKADNSYFKMRCTWSYHAKQINK